MTIVGELQALLGAEQVHADAVTLRAAATDTWPLRLVQSAVGGEPMPGPLCVVRPRAASEVAQALQLLYQGGVAVVPRGGGSGVQGGAEPPPGSVVLDLSNLDQILSLDEDNLSVTAQAGVRLHTLEQWLNERGYVGGHYPQSIEQAQLGGLVATRSAGQLSTRYGSIEDLLLGLAAVLPDGTALRIGATPRCAGGPDLRQLFLGSEGTLGVMTEVTLKVFPKPEATWRSAYALPSFTSGLDVMRRIMRPGWRPAVVRLYDAIETERSFPDQAERGTCLLLCAAEGPRGLPELEGAAIDSLAREVGAQPLGSAPVEAWFGHRNDVRAFYQYVQAGVIVDTIDVSVSWSCAAQVYQAVLAGLRHAVPELMVASAHASHAYPQGTSLYFVVGAQPPRDAAAVERIYRSIWSTAMQAVLANGGSICHHHGIGKLRAPWLAQQQSASVELLRQVKAALDPRGTMNPGTLLA